MRNGHKQIDVSVIKLNSTVKRATSAPLTSNPFTAVISCKLYEGKGFPVPIYKMSFDFCLFLKRVLGSTHPTAETI